MQFLDLHFPLQISTTLNSMKTDVKVVLSKYTELTLASPDPENCESQEVVWQPQCGWQSPRVAVVLWSPLARQAALHSLLPPGH